MNLGEWKELCRKAWENDYNYLQIDRFAKIEEGRYTIRISKKKVIWNVHLKRNFFNYKNLRFN